MIEQNDDYHDMIIKIIEVIDDRPISTSCISLCILLIGMLKLEDCTKDEFIRKMELAWDSCENSRLNNLIDKIKEESVCH